MVDAAEGRVAQPGLACGVQADVQALGTRHRQPAHHHRQHVAQADRGAGQAAQFQDTGRDDGRVGAAQREVEVNVRGRGQRHGRGEIGVGGQEETTDTVTLRAQVLQPLFQMVQAVQAPIPFSRVVEGGAQVVPQALAQLGPKLEHMRFELALRGLGQRDEAVAEMLAEVDALRLSLFEQKFLQLTGDVRKAAELAALFYLAVVGCYQALSRPAKPPQLKDYLQRLITTYLIQQQLAPKPMRRSK